MSPDIVIRSVNYQKPPEKPIKQPRERFLQYYRDLYKHLGRSVDESVFMEGSQATYSELGERVLEVDHRAGRLDDLDLMVASYWAYEFDPDHASCGAYLAHQFKLDCKMFDVCDQGTISPFTAVKIINSFIKHEKINKALLLILEQTTIPRSCDDYDSIPADAGAVSVILEKSSSLGRQLNKNDLYRVAQADTILDQHMANSADEIYRLLLEKYISQLDFKTKTQLYLRKNSYLWHMFQLLKSKIQLTIEICPFESKVGSIQPWMTLNQLVKNHGTNRPNLIFLDQDVESLNAGILVLEPL